MTVEVDEQQTEKLLKAAAQRISRQVEIPGFRPGKAPYRIVLRRFGEEAIRDEALEDLSKSVFQQALKQANLEPYAQASLEEITWDPLVMKIRVPVAPIVELGDYRAMRLESPPIEVTEEELNEALEALREEYAGWKPVERPAQLGDLVIMDVRERVGDELLHEGENIEYELTEMEEDESGPDLSAPLIGLSAGEEKEFTLTYPETFPEERYAGQEVTVWVRVHSVKEKEFYPLDDDFAQTVGDFDTLQQLKEKLREDIREQKEAEADEDLAEEALKQLVERVERVEWPPEVEEEEIDQLLEEQEHKLQRSNLSLDTYLSIRKQTRDELREELRPVAQERLRRSLVLGRFIELENLSVTEYEVLNEIDRLSWLAGEESSEMRQALATPEGVRYVANDLLVTKAKERLLQIVKGQAEAETEAEIETEAESE